MFYLDRNFDIYKDPCDIRIKGPLFECDELMAPIIRELNLKGYKTVFCCSGHVCDNIYAEEEIGDCSNNENCYIAFAESADTLIIKGFKLPEGFEFEDPEFDVEDCGYMCIIRRWFDSDTPRFTQMLDISKSLYEWVRKLPKARLDISSISLDASERLLEYA